MVAKSRTLNFSGMTIQCEGIEVGSVKNSIGGSPSSTIGFGSGKGVGGAVTQGTNRTTGVTLSKLTGAITLFAAAPTVGTYTTFVLTNTLIGANDIVVAMTTGNAANVYSTVVSGVAAGSCKISVTTVSGTTSDSAVVTFAIIRGAAS